LHFFSIKRIGDLQALSVASLCLEFASGMMKDFLQPRPGYIPKFPTNIAAPIVQQAFSPLPLNTPDQEKLAVPCVGFGCLHTESYSVA